MNQKDPQDIAKAIIEKYALASDLQDVLQAQDAIARAIQDERDRLESRIQVLDVRPGDTLFISTPDMLTDRAYTHVENEFVKLFPHTKIVILEKGLYLHSVVRGEVKV